MTHVCLEGREGRRGVAGGAKFKHRSAFGSHVPVNGADVFMYKQTRRIMNRGLMKRRAGVGCFSPKPLLITLHTIKSLSETGSLQVLVETIISLIRFNSGTETFVQ